MSKKPVLHLGSMIQTKDPSAAAVSQSAPTVAPPAREASVALTVKMNERRYARLRQLSHETGKTHKDLMLEAFDQVYGPGAW